MREIVDQKGYGRYGKAVMGKNKNTRIQKKQKQVDV
jgi:hypothetical protein